MLIPVLKIGTAVAIGAGIGAMIGSTRSCESGGCPLTANPRRGAIYGGLMGLLFGFVLLQPSGPSLAPDSGIIEVESAAHFSETVEQPNGTVVAYFHAPWCGTCRRVGPVISDVARNHSRDATFLAVNTDDNPDVAQELSVQYLPTSIVFRNGRETARFVGVFDTAQLLEVIHPQHTASRKPLTSPH